MACKQSLSGTCHVNLRYKACPPDYTDDDFDFDDASENVLDGFDADEVLDELCPNLDISDLKIEYDYGIECHGKSANDLIAVGELNVSVSEGQKQSFNGLTQEVQPTAVEYVQLDSALPPSPPSKRLPSVTRYANKPIAFSREQARQWRRKRLLQSCSSLESSSDYSSVSSDSSVSSSGSGSRCCQKEVLLVRRQKVQSTSILKSSGKCSSEMVLKKLSDPLLGGEKIKSNREPLPMKLRALPSSFWSEPQTVHTSSLAGSNYSVLPPVFSSERNCSPEDLMSVRPVTPPDGAPPSPTSLCGSRKFTSPPDTELLFSLFDHLESKVDDRLIVRRGRPKKQSIERFPRPPAKDMNNDPCIVSALAENLFPCLSLNQKPSQSNLSTASNSRLIRLGEGARKIEFPAIPVEKNYSEMLSELVTHM